MIDTREENINIDVNTVVDIPIRFMGIHRRRNNGTIRRPTAQQTLVILVTLATVLLSSYFETSRTVLISEELLRPLR